MDEDEDVDEDDESFHVERSVVKVTAHTPAGICPLPVFAPGLRINVEVGDQS